MPQSSTSTQLSIEEKGAMKTTEEKRAYHRKWEAANKDKTRAYRRKRYLANTENIKAERREYGREYRAKNREKLQAKWRTYNKLYREANPEKIKAHKKKYATENVELIRKKHNAYSRTDAGRWKYLKQQAKDRKITISISLEEFLKIRTLRCTYCNSVLPEVGSGIDRIDSSLGYVPGNCTPCCSNCNRAKSDMSSEEFKAWIIAIFQSWVCMPRVS